MQVFVYGTLTNPERVDAVLDDWSFAGPATLVGLRRVDGRYPTLAPPADDGSSARVQGRLLRTSEMAALDAYEGVDRRLYVRASLPVAGGGTAATYVGDPDRLDAPATWPGEGPFAERVRRWLAERDVAVDPGEP